MLSRLDRRTSSGVTTRRRRKRHRTRLTLYSMLATVALLCGAIWLGPYFVLQPRVETMPSKVPFSPQEWMSYVPDSAEFVAYVNYRATYEATGNSSFFGTDPLLEVYSPAFKVYPNSVEYELGINLAAPSGTQGVPAVSVIKIGLDEARSFETALSSTPGLHKSEHGSHEIFSLLIRRKELEVQLVSASIAISWQHVLLAQGAASAASVMHVLDTADHSENQLFSESSARTALYASSGGDDRYLALFLAAFPTQIEGANIAIKTVTTDSESFTSRFAFSFNSTDQAKAHYDSVKRLYVGGKEYWLLGPFVVATFEYDLTKLADQIRGL
jgi:hypothetical protein